MTKKSKVKGLKDLILKKAKEGKILFMTIEGLIEADVEKFIKQPTEGILYDLNRDRATVLTHLNNDNIKWVNDFAVGVVISKLKEYYDKISAPLSHRILTIPKKDKLLK